ncbi:hypothetical protein PIB30_104520, partial [Stylosanthes scabra]|nr:hypothetical protein [Stylosanthes scabra]
ISNLSHLFLFSHPCPPQNYRGPLLSHQTVVDGAINEGVTHISLLCCSSLTKLRSLPSSAPPSFEEEPPSSVVCSPFEAPVLAAVAGTTPPSSSTQSRRRSRKWKDKCFSIHGSVCDALSQTQREKLIEQVTFNSWLGLKNEERKLAEQETKFGRKTEEELYAYVWKSTHMRATQGPLHALTALATPKRSTLAPPYHA